MSNETDVSLTVAARLRAIPGVTSQSVLFLCLLCALMAMCGPAASAVTWTDAGAALTPLYRGDAAWGDYDNDGDLDLAMAGSTGPSSIAVVYRNDGGAFTDITGNLSPLKQPSGVTWADVNRDGNLDFLLLGPATKLYVQRTGHSGFNEAPFPLTYLSQSTADWGDYDNDGDLDLALTGYVEATMSYLAGVFRNEGGAFVQAPTPITHVSQGDLRWADYDNDGDLDLVDTDKGQTRVFRSESGLFVQALALSNGLAALADWGDFDSDGDFDLSLVYCDYYYNVFGCDVRRNDSGSFSRIVSPFTQVAEGYSEWGDYDNDGDLDLAMMGDRRTSDSATRYVSKLFANTAGVFGETAVPWDQMGKGAVHWADYDRDGDLDILLVGSVGTGSPSIRTRLYRSSGVAPNEAPAAPGGLSASAAGNTVTLSWAAATDAETPVAGLTYNVRVGTSPGGVDVVSPQSDVVTGVRRVQAFGNAGERLAWTLQNAPVGNLYWSVQALDSAYAGGAWAPESVVIVSADTSAPPTPVVADEGYSTASRSELRASWITSDQGSGIAEYLYAIGTAPSDPGSGYTVPWTSAGTAPHVTAAGMGLVPGQTYYFYVKARNGQGSYSAVGVSDGIVPGVLKPTGLEDSAFSSYGMPCGQSIGGASDPDADIAFWPGGSVEPDQYGVAIVHVPLNGIGTGGLKTSGGAILSIYQIDSGNARMRHVESSVPQAVDGSEYCDLPLSAPLPGFGAAGWHSFDVTVYIAADVAAGRSHAGFIIDAPEAGGFGTIALSENAAGNGPYMTIQQQPDTTAPSRPVVVDEGLNTSDSSRLSASWSSVDIESGIAEYRYAIGTSPTDTGSGYIVGWKPAGLATSATETGLSLAVGVTYYWYVQSVNGAGVASPTGASDGIALDPTPPSTPIVTDDGAVTPKLSQIHATWLATDDKSAIAEYEFAVGTSPQDPGSGYVSVWTSVGASTEGAAGDLMLQPEQTYYVYARARNAVGLWGPVGVSDGIKAPQHFVTGYIRPSGNQDGYVSAYQAPGATNVAAGSAIGFVGVESNKWYTEYFTTIIHYPLASLPRHDRVILGLNNRAGLLSHIVGAVANDVSASDFSLPYSTVTTGTYYADVTAEVAGDLAAGRSFSAFRLDAPDSYIMSLPLSGSGALVAPNLEFVSFTGPGASHPTTPVVVDDGATTQSTAELHATWTSSDPDSGVVLFAYATGETPEPPSDYHRWSYTTANGATASGLYLYDAHTYHVFVRALNGRGVWSDVGVSDGIMVQATTPFVDRHRIYSDDGDSATAWGDFDGDGWLDIGIVGAFDALLFRNNADDTFSALELASGRDLAWADYNGDGRLDLAVGTTHGLTLFRNDGAGLLTPLSIPEPIGWASSPRWADYDNDGDLDLAVCGNSADVQRTYLTRIYRNDGADIFVPIDAGLVGASGPLWWADYDRDGDMDLLVSGDSSYSDTKAVTILYRNNGGTFVNSGVALPQVQWMDAAWGDYDADGDLDFVMAGTLDSDEEIVRRCRNTGTGFAVSTLDVGTTYIRGLGFADYDADGDLDLAVSGPASTYGVRLYRNDHSSFVDSGISVPARALGGLCWGDYNNDGRLDIVAPGYDSPGSDARHLYTNNMDVPANTPPSAPQGLQAVKTSDGVRFTWLPAADAETPSAGLSYNLRVGTVPGKDDVMAAMADPVTGFRRIVGLGNVNTNLQWALHLPGRIYYWSVQAVDGAYAGGKWATEQVFVLDTAIYSSGFETGAGSEWSVFPVGDADHPPVHVSATPAGARAYLGEFGAQTIRLTLDNLPPHYRAEVSFDLFVIRSWDGSTGYDPTLNAVVGPDIWSLRFDEQEPLIRTTFSNVWNYPIAGKTLDFRQAYPQSYPAGDNPARMGAQEVNTLGYLSSTHPMDSVYHITAAGAHSGSTLVVEFSAPGLQAIADESWGLDNVLVTLGFDATPPSAPMVLDDGIATTSTSQLHATWSASDAESGMSEYRYAVGTTPADPGSGYLVPWTSAGVNTGVTVTGLSLARGQRYTFYVTAANGAGLESAAGSSDGIMAVASSLSSIGEAKKLPDGTAISINDVIVTATPAQMGDRMYVEAADRASGIGVSTPQAVETGDVLSVAGVLATSGGERVLTSPAFAPFVSGPPLDALSMSLRDAASRAFFFSSATGAGQRGVTDPGAYGLSTIGLLVRVTGVVSDIDPSFVTITDGSWPFSTGVRVSREYAPADISVLDSLIVTGVSTIRQTGPAYQMLIRPREPSDWTRP